MKTYKGTDKDMRCHGGYQYEIGKLNKSDGAIRCGNKGFHSCEAPMDVLRYFPLRDGNRYFVAEAGGTIDRTGAGDSKIASSELTIKSEIDIRGLIEAQKEYTREKAEAGTTGGYNSNLAGGDESNLAGGNKSNLAGGDESNLAGGDESNLAGGNWSNLAGGDRSNLAGGDRSNLAGGNWSSLAGGNKSNLAGGYGSVIVGGDGSRVKAGLGSLLVFARKGYSGGKCLVRDYKAVIVDGENIKADTWYEFIDGEVREAASDD